MRFTIQEKITLLSTLERVGFFLATICEKIELVVVTSKYIGENLANIEFEEEARNAPYLVITENNFYPEYSIDEVETCLTFLEKSVK